VYKKDGTLLLSFYHLHLGGLRFSPPPHPIQRLGRVRGGGHSEAQAR
jgi:hypothetical protein